MFEIVSSHPYLLAECPVWYGERYLFTDIKSNELYTVEGNEIKKIAEGLSVAGFAENKNGGLVVGGATGVYFWDEKQGFTLIASEYEGNPLKCNDASTDPCGRFLIGTNYYNRDPEGNFPRGRLYALNKDRSIKVLADGIGLANGIGFSPDKKTLYLTDTYAGEIYAYDYDVQNCTASNKRTAVKVPKEIGIPDGMTVDSEGYIWSAIMFAGLVIRFDPDGKEERRLSLPATQVSSVMFGGKDLNELFVTTAADIARLPIAPSGFDFDHAKSGGIYKFKLDIKGMPEYKADIDRD